jgi:hypothetical protein
VAVQRFHGRIRRKDKTSRAQPAQGRQNVNELPTFQAQHSSINNPRRNKRQTCAGGNKYADHGISGGWLAGVFSI